MAIDNAVKRASMLSLDIGCLLPPPTGTVDANARAMHLLLYANIAAVPLVAVDTFMITLPAFNREIDVG